MTRRQQYKIISGITTEILERKVNELTMEGWTVSGDMLFIKGVFYQPITCFIHC